MSPNLVIAFSLLVLASARAQEGVQSPPVRILEGHKGSVMCVAYSSDEKMLATSSRDDMIHFWNPQTGK